jgi:hypothetical protein
VCLGHSGQRLHAVEVRPDDGVLGGVHTDVGSPAEHDVQVAAGDGEADEAAGAARAVGAAADHRHRQVRTALLDPRVLMILSELCDALTFELSPDSCTHGFLRLLNRALEDSRTGLEFARRRLEQAPRGPRGDHAVEEHLLVRLQQVRHHMNV